MSRYPDPGRARPTVTLHCELKVGDGLMYVDCPVDREVWLRADEQARDVIREHARRALADAIVDKVAPPVTVANDGLTIGEAMAEGVRSALAKLDAESAL